MIALANNALELTEVTRAELLKLKSTGFYLSAIMGEARFYVEGRSDEV